MHLRAKEIALCGLLMALGVICISAGAILENITLFFIFTACFIEGISVRFYSPAFGIIYLVGTAVLAFFIAPNKLYVFTFLTLGIYLFTAEVLEKKKVNVFLKWVVKLAVFILVFSAAYFALFLFFSEDIMLISGDRIGDISGNHGFVGFILIFVIFLISVVICDRVYFYFMNKYGNCIKSRLFRQ